VRLVQIVDAVGERERKTTRRMTFAMVIAQVARFGDEFIDGFYVRHVG